jgi:hypothetical protein
MTKTTCLTDGKTACGVSLNITIPFLDVKLFSSLSSKGVAAFVSHGNVHRTAMLPRH